MAGTGYEPIADDELYEEINRRLLTLAGHQGSQVVLDVGCGTGSLSSLLLKYAEGTTIWAFDPDLGMVKAARERIGAKAGVLQASAESFGDLFPAGFADLVLFGNCIHLVGDLAGTLQQCQRVLKNDGRIAFNTAFFDGAEAPADRGLYWRLIIEAYKIIRDKHGSRQHQFSLRSGIRSLSPADYCEALKKAGFAAITQDRIEVKLNGSLLLKILSAPIFAGGALPGVEPLEAAATLKRAAETMSREQPEKTISRGWLYIVGQKSPTC